MPNSSSFLSAWLKPLSPRDPHEKHRVATSLELLFDLIFVVAIAAAGQQLHHALVENHILHGLELYLMVFFALRYAFGIMLVQCGWLLFHFSPVTFTLYICSFSDC